MNKSSNEVFPWGNRRRFNAYSDYFKRVFGERVQKVTIDAGFTCPNRDGTVGKGGCTYCNNDAFNPSYCNPGKSVAQQIDEGVEFHRNRYRQANKYLAYFQAYSNTYAPLHRLKAIYNEALRYPGIIGLVIGTRPDCIDDEKLDYFAALSEDYYMILEYGIESFYNRTLKHINRGHSVEDSITAVEKTAQKGIKTGAHLIFGLPGETREDMLREADLISRLPLDTVKFHQLQILKDTAMAKEYQDYPERFTLFELDDYIDFIIGFMERLNPDLVIERFSGEVPPWFLSGPGWGLIRTYEVRNKLEQRMVNRDTWQGKYYKTVNI
ncbi:MAG: TIGR01212 family radical SAM protein [Bacteroidales bacterium]|nr:TIGR01212 family radical SAM protein [Bacteroidales bacterium]